tara:strand:+ start:404 stop:592 length:189 start_codon:yes stop_codon:yes gene_type:complete
MVELEVDDYGEIMDWFILAFGKRGKTMTDLPQKAKLTFYKLNFLAEDKIKEEKERLDTSDVE